MSRMPQTHCHNRNNRIIHSLHKNTNKSAISLALDFKLSETTNRYSHASPIYLKVSTRSKGSKKFMNYPSIFQNKASNIKRILKNKKSSDHLEKIIQQNQKENKNSLIFSYKHQDLEYYNFDYIYHSTNPSSKAIQKSIQGKISCKGFHAPSCLKETVVSQKKMLWQKRKDEQRMT